MRFDRLIRKVIFEDCYHFAFEKYPWAKTCQAGRDGTDSLQHFVVRAQRTRDHVVLHQCKPRFRIARRLRFDQVLRWWQVVKTCRLLKWLTFGHVSHAQHWPLCPDLVAWGRREVVVAPLQTLIPHTFAVSEGPSTKMYSTILYLFEIVSWICLTIKP